MYAHTQIYTREYICFGYRCNSQISPKAKILFHYTEFDEKNQNCLFPQIMVFTCLYMCLHIINRCSKTALVRMLLFPEL